LQQIEAFEFILAQPFADEPFILSVSSIFFSRKARRSVVQILALHLVAVEEL
jgi:hypothetical protein